MVAASLICAIEKLKAGIFQSPQIRKLIIDAEYENSMKEVELEVATKRPVTTLNLSPIC